MHRVRAVLLGEAFLSHDLFDAAAIGRVLDEHAAGSMNHAQAIWLLLAFEGFLHTLDAAAPLARADAASMVVHAG